MISVPPTESGNLVEHFAEKLSAKTGIPRSHGLVKTRKTEPQKIYQNFSLKRSNVRGAFRYENPAEVKGKSILLVDDIYDSGATIKEIGKVMSRLGVHKIAPLVIAKTVRGDLRDDEPNGTVDTVAITSSTVKESKPLAAIRKKYPRAYEKWTKGDEKELLSMYNAGATIEELANHFQRKRSAITSRLTTLMSKDAILDVSKDASVDGSAASDGIASSRLKEAEIFQVLKKWRLETSKNQELPPYYIFPDKTLHHIAQAKPSSLLELLDVKGLGKKTVKRYGEELLALIKGCEAKHAEG
jgi:hypoxanthine phosphoribosyltransferase